MASPAVPSPTSRLRGVVATKPIGRRGLLAAVVAGLAAVVPACSDGELAEPTPEIAEQLTTTTEEPAADVIPGAGGGEATTTTLPGDGRTVVVATGTRLGDDVVAARVVELLATLGYEVLDPTSFVFDEWAASRAVAEGDIDLWVGRWSPLDDGLELSTSDGSPVADAITELVAVDGAAVGLRWEGPTVENDDDPPTPSLWALLTDPSVARRADHDGDGRPEIWNCDPRSACAAWLATLDDVLPSEPGERVRFDDVVQPVPLVGGEVDVDPAVGRVVFAADLATSTDWLAGTIPESSSPTTTAPVAPVVLPPGPWETNLTIVAGSSWLDEQPESVVEALEALDADAALGDLVRDALGG